MRFWCLGHERMEARKGVGDGKEVVTCSVCLEAVTGCGGRATARLLCQHQFHLDCIGSAFNVKGVMECPNCREVEKGCWLYSDGPHTPSDVSMGERIHDGELSNFHHQEMPFGVHWCPFGRVATIPLPFDSRPGASNSTIQSLVPLYPRAPVSINQQDYYHNLQNTPGSMVPPMPRVGGLRSIRLAPQPRPDHAPYFLFPPMSGQNRIGDEIIPRHQFYTWECERFTPYPLVPFHVESSGWRPFAQPTNGGRPENLIRAAPICLARMHS